MKKLVIISHTPHQLDDTLGPVGWGPTINEINFLASYWDEVVHVACLEKRQPSGSSLPYTAKNIVFMPIPPFGGRNIVQKANILWLLPKILQTIRHAIKGASHVQLRVPMGIGVFLIPFFALQWSRPYHLWIKYANNWGQVHPPVGFWLQRYFLKKNIARCKVTINGFWPNQEKHCISFENPCLSETQIEQGQILSKNKTFQPPFRLVFAGRLEDEKGVSRILDALLTVSPGYVEEMVFIGTGPRLEDYRKYAEQLSLPVVFTGDITQYQVHNYFSTSHFILLPTTASEGFPKVLAEAACYGCIPICTELASIGHYIKHMDNGILVKEKDLDIHFKEYLQKAINTAPEILSQIAIRAAKFAGLFTFENYIFNLKTRIF